MTSVRFVAIPLMAALVAETGAAIVLMHMQGTPQTMQKAPRYQNVIEEVSSFLCERAQAAIKQWY